MATTFRADRASEAIRMCISKALRNDIQDPALQDVTITKVECTHDISFARVYFTVMGDDQVQARNEALAGFDRAMPFLRSKVAEEVPLRTVPELGFRYDKGIENALRLEEIFSTLPELNKE